MSQPLTIGYAGTLMSFDLNTPVGGNHPLKQWFWGYKPDNINFTTRSGYYIFKGIQRCKEKYGLTGSQLQLDLWGNIDPGNQQQVEEFGIQDMVQISGHRSKEETLNRMNECDVLLLPLESEKNGQKPLFIPGKLYDYLLLEKPILALCGESDCLDILTKSGLGAVASPYDEDAIADLLHDLCQHQGELRQKYPPNQEYIDTFDVRHLTGQLAQIFNQVLDA